MAEAEVEHYLIHCYYKFYSCLLSSQDMVNKWNFSIKQIYIFFFFLLDICVCHVNNDYLQIFWPWITLSVRSWLQGCFQHWLKFQSGKPGWDFNPVFWKKYLKNGARAYMKKVSARFELPGMKILCNRTKDFQLGWKNDWQAWKDVNFQNNKGYWQIPAWVRFRFQFQPGLKYFM